MAGLVTLHTAFMLVSTLISGAIVYLTWRNRDKPLAAPLVVVTLGLFGWSLGSLLARLVSSLPTTLAAWNVALFSLHLAIVGWFYVAAEYTEHERLRRPSLFVALLVVPLGTQIVAWTNASHGLFYTPETYLTQGYLLVVGEGPLYWVQTIYMFVASLVPTVYIALNRESSRGLYRRQTVALVGSMLVIWVTSVLEVFDIEPWHDPSFNVMLLGTTIAVVGLFWAVVYADFLDVVPIARETLVEQMDDAVVALNTDQRIVGTNPPARVLLDLNEDVVGSDAATAFADYPALLDLSTTDEERETEFTLDRDGSRRRLHASSTPVRDTSRLSFDDDARLVGQLLMLRDVTTRHRREQRLREHERELEAKNERLEEFARVVSHDLQNPLSVAAGNVELLRDEYEPERLDAIADAIERMDTIVDDVLELARAGQTIADPRPVSLDAVAQDAWRTTETRDADLVVETETVVQGDGVRLQQLFENLFRNSVAHGSTSSTSLPAESLPESGGPSVTVTVGDHESGFFVADDGPGIPPDVREQVFEEGYTTASDGTGFGLAIVDNLATAHGWDVSVTESSSGGARFEFHVPDPDDS
ncbi:histidine kinase N-terminal 7TM domain-containing protein [Haloarculaceae archaeon H-GB2-1]|nr:histidine kinase N-terminal 7TM domain-containing protein [Haloarculaceae archaeon H-GB1-1]MEA5388873.1 histidine kinase N-terminal 7TM domain-containing protein [Haloarculaceae archaeon H-GB11]MEA5406927.1 histidine kinase N-terminal 7TM domain-containing protein [Haloarculaceae archaeon H-GB2-1]